MSKSTIYSNALLKLIFNGVAMANVADNAATAPLTDLWVSLHTADPGEAGDQSTNEATYAAYARVAVARSSSGWTVAGNKVNPVANIDFPKATGGVETITHFGVGTVQSGAGKLFYRGSVAPNILVTSNIVPRLETDTSIEED